MAGDDFAVSGMTRPGSNDQAAARTPAHRAHACATFELSSLCGAQARRTCAGAHYKTSRWPVALLLLALSVTASLSAAPCYCDCSTHARVRCALLRRRTRAAPREMQHRRVRPSVARPPAGAQRHSPRPRSTHRNPRMSRAAPPRAGAAGPQVRAHHAAAAPPTSYLTQALACPTYSTARAPRL